ncbi:glycosyltransferase family 39 protein [Candidatus Collierbacteria bacterium]|nr:glycosyltransferase family 39 protein [Candidatus Collierbacteria bacterium]
MKNRLILAILILAFLLRVPFLDKFPAGLNADEAAIGYNAYSLIKTGHDEHGVAWPLVFRSFDDYKPAVYFYLVLPFVYFMGLSVWAVRLPSALLSVLSVYFIYLLTNKLFPNKSLVIRNSSFDIGVVAAAMIAISPWHLHFSRGGWEANTASVFMLIGLYFLIKSLLDTRYFLLTTVLFVLALYTYHSLRVVIPLVSICFLVIYFQKIKDVLSQPTQIKPISIALILGALALLPLALQFTSDEGRSRFTGVSIFADEGPLWEALELRREDGSTPLARVLHNRYFTYSYRFAKNYLSHLSPRFLFITGDEIARSKVPGMGQTYLLTLPFFIWGLLLLLRRMKAPDKLVLGWLFIAPIAAALTFQSPHALRSQNMIYPLTIITAIGLFELILFIKSLGIRALLVISYSTLVILGTYEVTRYLHQYYIHYPKELAYAWQYGFDQIAEYVNQHENEYDKIIISDRYDQPYILMAFFLKYPPEKIQREAVLEPRDKFGFSTVRKFGKYEFRRIDYGQDEKIPHALVIAADEAVNDSKIINDIKDPGGNIIWRFVKSN